MRYNDIKPGMRFAHLGDMAAKNLFAIADALNVDPRNLIEKAEE